MHKRCVLNNNPRKFIAYKTKDKTHEKLSAIEFSNQSVLLKKFRYILTKYYVLCIKQPLWLMTNLKENDKFIRMKKIC